MEIIKEHIISSNQVFENILLDNSNNQKWQPKARKHSTIVEAGKETLVPQLIEAIDSANKMICLQSFLIQEMAVFEAIEAAQKRDVKVFILTSNAHLNNAPTEEEESFHRPSYEKMLNERIKGKMLLRSAEYFHAKFLLIDPNTKNAQGFLTTANFTQKPLEENPELGVKLDKKQVTELFQIFVYHFWECATHEQSFSKHFESVKPRKYFEIPKTNTVLFLSKNSTQLKDYVLETIQNATKRIVISSFNYDVDNAIGKLLFEKLNKGIEVVLFIPERKKAIFKQVDKLLQAGAKVFVQPKLHAKFLLCDNEKGIVLSANFDTITGNWFETGVVLSNQQIEELQVIIEDWKQRFSKKMIAKISIDKAPTSFTFFTKRDEKSMIINVKQEDEKSINISKPTISKVKNIIKKQKIQNTKKLILQLKLNVEDWKKEELNIEKELSNNINLIEIRTKGKAKKTRKAILIKKDFTLKTLLDLPQEYHNLQLFGL